MPPDDAGQPQPRAHPASSTHNAVRGGVLAAMAAGDAEEAPPAAEAAPKPAPARGFGASLRAAGRRGLLAVRPLAAPFLHRFQMRVRTAVDESDAAARIAGIERALARLGERHDAEAAILHEIAGLRRLAADNARRLEALGRSSDATRRDIAEAAEIAATKRDVAGVMEVAADNARRLDALRGDVASVSDAVRSNAPRRPPIPVGGDFLVHTPDGMLLVPGEDLRFLAVIADGGVLETGTRRVLAALLRPGSAFLDVGANVGTMTLFAARAVGPAGRVFAVEPTPRIAALLRRSMAVNDVADRVAISECAAGDGEGEALLHLEEVMSHNTLLPPDEAEGRGTVRVRVSPADALVPAGTAVDVAKVDAEGAELQVWRGMGRILAESPGLAAVLEFGRPHLARAGVSPEAWLREVEAPGFVPYMIDDMAGVCRPASASSLSDVFSVNVLLLRPGAAERHPGLVFA
ncbi:hypothetical protein GCM10009416_02910 [Craurococcus roseus]|uniref:Methyltransferase FkbM domain-containing protein n=1 Tax=Craurococcus roseus TaxID=77585 RepID=A0ABP3PN36_9PROT